jgi:hypothetical protein
VSGISSSSSIHSLLADDNTTNSVYVEIYLVNSEFQGFTVGNSVTGGGLILLHTSSQSNIVVRYANLFLLY